MTKLIYQFCAFISAKYFIFQDGIDWRNVDGINYLSWTVNQVLKPLNSKQVFETKTEMLTLILFTAYPDILRILLGSGICVCIGG